MAKQKRGTINEHGKIEMGSELSQLFALTKIIKVKYSWLNYRIDFAAGLKLPPRLAGMQAKLQKGDSYPDIFFPHPIKPYHGLYIEFKKHKSEVFNADGVTMVQNEHIRKQWAELQRLRGQGYKAEWGLGIDHALSVIEAYLSGS